MKKVIMSFLIAIFLHHGAAFGSFNFIDNGNGTVTDARTGLVWLKNANPCGTMPWVDAGIYCSNLANGQAGLTDGSTAGQWRLPGKEELEGIGTDPAATWELGYPSVPWTTPAAPFTNVQTGSYWTGTAGWGTDLAWFLTMDGRVSYSPKNCYPSFVCYYVWPVRGPIEITTTTTTTTTICDADYWQALYEQSQAQLEQSQAALESCQTALEKCQNPPTNIELSTLNAVPSNEKVMLRWRTESETDNAGFNIWRADNFVKVNKALIPAIGSSVSGSEYDFVDEWVLNGKRYFYLLEDIDTNGISTFHGPVKAVPRWWK